MNSQTISRKRALRLALKVALVVLIGVLAWMYLPLSGPEDVKRFIAGYGALAPVVFIGVTAAKPLLFFLPSMGLTIVAGTLFGPVYGTIYVIIGGAVSSVVGFYATRLLGRERVKAFVSENSRLFSVDEKMTADGFKTTLTLRAFNLPWDIVSYAAGLSGMRFRDFYLATLILLGPTSFVYTFFGSTVMDYTSYKFYLGALLIVLFAVLPHLYMRFFKKGSKPSVKNGAED